MLQDWPLTAILAGFAVTGAIIALIGVRLAKIAEALAHRTGMGQIIAGAVFIGASTSLPGIITSVTTAYQGYPGIAVGNALGGLTAQTAFIAIADLCYRRVNLEHAAASATGLAQGVLFAALLTIPLIASVQPQVTVLGVHPASVLTVAMYALGLHLLGSIRSDPMWRAVQTPETVNCEGERDELADDGTRSLWLRFALYATITAAAGYLVGQSGVALVARTGMSESAAGTAFTAVTTSLPELVTAVAAVRIGAVRLAVGDVIGGNAFDLLFLSAADVAYPGSIYGVFGNQDRTTALIALLMTGMLLLGMLRRAKGGFGGIGFESAAVLLLYALSIVLLFA